MADAGQFISNLLKSELSWDSFLNDEDRDLYMRAFSEVNRSVGTETRDRGAKRNRNSSVPDFGRNRQQQVPHTVPSLHYKFQPTVEEKRVLAEQGIRIREGRYRREEDSLIITNLDNFVKLNNVSDINFLFGCTAQCRAFRREKNFFVRLAHGLDERTLYSVYTRAKRLSATRSRCSSRPKKGEPEPRLCVSRSTQIPEKWECSIWEKPVRKCRENQVLNGKRRSQTTRRKFTDGSEPLVRKRRRTVKFRKKAKKGCVWTAEEENRLVETLKRYVGTKRMLIPLFNHPWTKIAREVPNKTVKQCRKRWADVLYWSFKSCRSSEWSDECFALLIYLLHMSIAKKEEFVDWDVIFEFFKSAVPTYSRLRLYWDKLKHVVPNYHQRCHDEIVLYLYHKHLPKLLKKCNLQFKDLQCKAESLFA